MSTEEFYKKLGYPEMDKFDKKSPKFDYHTLLEFAEEYANEQLKLCDVMRSATESAQLISALNNTIVINKQVGTYIQLEKDCIAKIHMLVNEIKENKM